ncbi:hypothetical protein FA95DRAFT_1317371 [Auriscalpium vulgare]|uniref:Uncharacterized protein n=1 Tax=Auriscalpium vulgare TaxID=40419 RepID=A0ACB8S8C0_9AGAM|nr:hypothetical protein FA95DRAFT_1317371 [Auriscalpium vulgare]
MCCCGSWACGPCGHAQRPHDATNIAVFGHRRATPDRPVSEDQVRACRSSRSMYPRRWRPSRDLETPEKGLRSCFFTLYSTPYAPAPYGSFPELPSIKNAAPALARPAMSGLIALMASPHHLTCAPCAAVRCRYCIPQHASVGAFALVSEDAYTGDRILLTPASWAITAAHQLQHT